MFANRKWVNSEPVYIYVCTCMDTTASTLEHGERERERERKIKKQSLWVTSDRATGGKKAHLLKWNLAQEESGKSVSPQYIYMYRRSLVCMHPAVVYIGCWNWSWHRRLWRTQTDKTCLGHKMSPQPEKKRGGILFFGCFSLFFSAGAAGKLFRLLFDQRTS